MHRLLRWAATGLAVATLLCTGAPAFAQGPEASTEPPGASPAEPPAVEPPPAPGTPSAPAQAPAEATPEDLQQVPPSTFEPTLAQYGTWVDAGSYGRVWRPSPEIVGVGFQPYVTGGYWVHGNPGWLFRSRFPFGSIVFHYGRWFPYGLGWVWSPGTTWGASWYGPGYGRGYAPAYWGGYGYYGRGPVYGPRYYSYGSNRYVHGRGYAYSPGYRYNRGYGYNPGYGHPGAYGFMNRGYGYAPRSGFGHGSYGSYGARGSWGHGGHWRR